MHVINIYPFHILIDHVTIFHTVKTNEHIYKEGIIHNEDGEALAQLPREAVDTPSLEMLKASLDGALGILIW